MIEKFDDKCIRLDTIPHRAWGTDRHNCKTISRSACHAFWRAI